MSTPSRPIRATLLGIAAALGLSVPASASLFDDVYYGTPVVTGYSSPVYVTSGYAYPTSYSSVLSPTVYSASSVLSPTVYSGASTVPSYYVTPTRYYATTASTGLFRRSWRPLFGGLRNSYYYDPIPTTYATVVPTQYVATASPVLVNDCCVGGVAASTTTVAPTYPAAPTNNAGTSNQGAATGDKYQSNSRPPSSLNSQPRDSGVGTGLETPAAPAEELMTPSLTEPGLDLETPQPDFNAAPDDDLGNLDGNRSALRPRPTDMTARTDSRALSTIQGQVVDDQSLQPRADKKIVFTDANRTYGDRIVTSDANGFFDAPLPNGDWKVSVEDADGTLTQFGQVTVVGDRVYNDQGRGVTSLRIRL